MTTAIVSLCHIFIAATRSPTRTGLTRRCGGVYSAPGQTFTAKQFAAAFNQQDGVHLKCFYLRRAVELLVR